MPSVDQQKLQEMSDLDLAAWQAMQKMDSPQYRLVEHIWQQRLLEKQLAASKHAARLAAISGIVGVIIGWLLSSWHPFR